MIPIAHVDDVFEGRDSQMGKFQTRPITFLLLPLMFALGWWGQEIHYDRDVCAAIDLEALESGGIFIPDKRLSLDICEMSQPW